MQLSWVIFVYVLLLAASSSNLRLPSSKATRTMTTTTMSSANITIPAVSTVSTSSVNNNTNLHSSLKKTFLVSKCFLGFLSCSPYIEKRSYLFYKQKIFKKIAANKRFLKKTNNRKKNLLEKNRKTLTILTVSHSS